MISNYFELKHIFWQETALEMEWCDSKIKKKKIFRLKQVTDMANCINSNIRIYTPALFWWVRWLTVQIQIPFVQVNKQGRADDETLQLNRDYIRSDDV